MSTTNNGKWRKVTIQLRGDIYSLEIVEREVGRGKSPSGSSPMGLRGGWLQWSGLGYVYLTSPLINA
jgi:hypothetical protein